MRVYLAGCIPSHAFDHLVGRPIHKIAHFLLGAAQEILRRVRFPDGLDVLE
jgi:hypothetical protein